jgi:hypothetical protein
MREVGLALHLPNLLDDSGLASVEMSPASSLFEIAGHLIGATKQALTFHCALPRILVLRMKGQRRDVTGIFVVRNRRSPHRRDQAGAYLSLCTAGYPRSKDESRIAVRKF